MILMIRNVRINGEGEPADVLTVNGQIAQIGRKLENPFPHAEVIDGDGASAIPGYIDQHVHVTGGGGEGGFKYQVPGIRVSDIVSAGVTTLVGLLGTDGTTRSVENLVAKVKGLKEEGLTAYCLTGAYEYPSPTITGSVKKDIAFIDEVIGVKIAISDHRCSNLSKRDLIRLASEARLGGVLANKPGIVHMHIGRGKKKLDDVFDILKTEDIPIQVFRPTHVGGIFDDAIRFANLGGYIDFTADPEGKKTAGQLVKAFSLAPKENITLSTDSNGSFPKWNEKKELIGMSAGKITNLHQVIRCLVQDYQIPLAEAIRVSTENVAKALKLYPRKGVLREGSDADLLLLDSDCRIDTVVAKGAVMMKNKKVLKKGVFEE